jgi:hypothetical protein
LIVRLLLLTLALAGPARAQGIYLKWTKCAADGGTSNKSFACNTNVQSHVLVTSFVLAAPMSVQSISGIIDVVAADAILPPWWEFRGCRSGSLIVNPAAVPLDACTFVGSSCSGGINSYVVGGSGPNTARIEFAGCAAGTAAAGIEYYGPVLVINSTRTLGSPSCAGCSTGVCLTLARLRLGTVDITTPAIPPNGNMVTWQGGGPGGMCQAVTAVRRSAWGEIKALYR